MTKPKSKLQKAKEKFIENWYTPIYRHFRDTNDCKQFRRQLNRLIKLAKEEGKAKP